MEVSFAVKTDFDQPNTQYKYIVPTHALTTKLINITDLISFLFLAFQARKIGVIYKCIVQGGEGSTYRHYGRNLHFGNGSLLADSDQCSVIKYR